MGSGSKEDRDAKDTLPVGEYHDPVGRLEPPQPCPAAAFTLDRTLMQGCLGITDETPKHSPNLS